MRLWAIMALAVMIASVSALSGCGGKAGGGIAPEQTEPHSSAPATTQLPSPSALHGASYTQQDLYHWGSEYEDTLPHNLVTRDSNQGVFTPFWVPPDGQFADLAYATYQFQLDGFDLEPSLHFS